MEAFARGPELPQVIKLEIPDQHRHVQAVLLAGALDDLLDALLLTQRQPVTSCHWLHPS